MFLEPALNICIDKKNQDMEQDEHEIRAHIIVHMRHMYIISVIVKSTPKLRI